MIYFICDCDVFITLDLTRAVGGQRARLFHRFLSYWDMESKKCHNLHKKLDRVIILDCLYRCDSWKELYKVLVQLNLVVTKIRSLIVDACKTRISTLNLVACKS